MKRILTIAVLIIVYGMILRCSNKSSAEQQDGISSEIPVVTNKLHLQTFSEYFEVTGTVKARNHINIMAEEGGTLFKIIHDKGSFVSKGDTLACLENLVLEAGYKESMAALHQAKIDFQSKTVLYNKKAISENEFLTSKFTLERAQAVYDLAFARYRKLFITSPLNGFVNKRYYDMGAYVMTMTPLFEFIDHKYVKITAGIAERFLNDIHKGTQVNITFDAFPDLVLNSKVSFVYQSIDPQSRTFQIEVIIKNPDYKLAPEMIANLRLLRRLYVDQIVVPLDAIMESENGRFVFIEQDQKAKQIPVGIMSIYGDSVLVSGLQKDQNLIVTGQHELTDGDTLTIVN